jgi:hypothetical protein
MFSHLIAANATLALKSGLWLRRDCLPNGPSHLGQYARSRQSFLLALFKNTKPALALSTQSSKNRGIYYVLRIFNIFTIIKNRAIFSEFVEF